MAYTGCRINEAIYLEWKDVNWDSGVAWLYFKVENDLKTEGSQAPFGLPDRLLAVLREWEKEKTCTWVFPNSSGKPWVTAGPGYKHLDQLKALPRVVDGQKITLQHSGHMLGSVQVAVELADGRRLGYSGDFRWPLEKVIEVDALVVDSTYGSPERKREYTQEQAEERFLNLVLGRIMRGPVYIKAHRGTIQRALQILTGQVSCPMLGSARLCNEVDVYRTHGYGIDSICLVTSEQGRSHLRSGRFIRLYGTGDEFPVQITKGSTITLSAYMARPDDPIMEYSDCAFGVALSNHADFIGTLEYIQATKAKYVVTDNTRGHGTELAEEVTRRLGVPAHPSTTTLSREWGMS
jgi:putative mRNA 3-end processing factor